MVTPLCLRCREPLEPTVGANGETLSYCARCGGGFVSQRDVGVALGLLAGDPRLEPVLARPLQKAGPCPSCEGASLLHGSLRLSPGVDVPTCTECHGAWLDRGVLGALRLRSLRAAPKAAPNTEDLVAYAKRFDEQGFAFDSPLVNGLTIPIALGFAFFVTATGFDAVVHGLIGMWLHEFGHAVVAWLAGFPAIPLPFFTQQLTEDRSNIAVALTFVCIALLGGHGVRERRPVFVALAASALGLQVLLTFVLNPAQAEKWVIFAGCGGEFVLATLLLSGFYHPLPPRFRWDFWRFPVVALAAMAFTHALQMWLRVLRDPTRLPRGSMMGKDDSNGDMDRLIRVYKFTPDGLTRAYLTIAVLCLLVLGVHYAWFYWSVRPRDARK